MYFASLDEAITLYLRRTNTTQEQLAKDCDMSDVTFSRKRRGVYGKEFSINEVARVAKVIGLTSFDGIMADVQRELAGVA